MVTSVSALARRFGVSPRTLSALFYNRVFDDATCPVIDGRRVIPESYVPTVEKELRDRGLIEQGAAR